MSLTNLPDVVLKHILSYLSFDEIARNRIICQRFNQIGWQLLNQGFYAAEEYQSNSLKAVKLLLPRRESERRKHPLWRKCDVLTAIETRLSMLSMAFGRFIEAKLCCFIPGKVIDELFRVMRSLDEVSDGFRDPYQQPQILQELRDVSTMAIEYFDDKIVPDLRRKEMAALSSQRGLTVFNITGELISTLNCDFHLRSSDVERCQSVKNLATGHVQYPDSDIYCSLDKEKGPTQSKKLKLAKRRDIHSVIKNKKKLLKRKKLLFLRKTVRQQNKLIRELTETCKEHAVRLSNNETVIKDLKKQHNEWNQKLSQKLSKFVDSSSDSQSSNLLDSIPKLPVEEKTMHERKRKASISN